MVRVVSFDRIVEVSLHVNTESETISETMRILCNAGNDIIDTVHKAIKKEYPLYGTMEKGMSYMHIDGNTVFVNGFCAWTMQGGKQNVEKIDNGYIEHFIQDGCFA